MKKLFAYSAALLSLALLAGCGDDRSTLTDRTKEVFDMGAAPVPNKPGYTLHGYRLINDMTRDHYVYILEKDNEPVSGTAMNYEYTQSSGKTTVTRTESISSVVAPSAQAPVATKGSAAADTCATVEECEAKIAELQKNIEMKPLTRYPTQLDIVQQRYKDMQRQ